MERAVINSDKHICHGKPCQNTIVPVSQGSGGPRLTHPPISRRSPQLVRAARADLRRLSPTGPSGIHVVITIVTGGLSNSHLLRQTAGLDRPYMDEGVTAREHQIDR